jgi:hypothetical protein
MNFEDCFHLVETVDLGAPLTIDRLHEYAVALGVDMFDSDQDCPSLWIIGNRAEGTAIIFEALYRDDDTKAAHPSRHRRHPAGGPLLRHVCDAE